MARNKKAAKKPEVKAIKYNYFETNFLNDFTDELLLKIDKHKDEILADDFKDRLKDTFDTSLANNEENIPEFLDIYVHVTEDQESTISSLIEIITDDLDELDKQVNAINEKRFALEYDLDNIFDTETMSQLDEFFTSKGKFFKFRELEQALQDIKTLEIE